MSVPPLNCTIYTFKIFNHEAGGHKGVNFAQITSISFLASRKTVEWFYPVCGDYALSFWPDVSMVFTYDLLLNLL